VNHCDVSDFEALQNRSLSVKDKIVLCRYGGIFRGNKVMNGQVYGAKAVLIFDDPIRSAPKEARDQIYPNGQFLPKDGVQRGSIYLKEGDPLTPIYPSTKTAYRIHVNQSKYLLKIPGQVIGYGLAQEILNMVDQGGELVPEKWRGDLNARYTFGGKLKDNK
jgi:N-acetylated-alpha-linked acidic dipeptidase